MNLESLETPNLINPKHLTELKHLINAPEIKLPKIKPKKINLNIIILILFIIFTIFFLYNCKNGKSYDYKVIPFNLYEKI